MKVSLQLPATEEARMLGDAAPDASRAASELDVGALHASHSDFVWRSLRRLGVAESELLDALQDVFLVAHRRRGTWRPETRVTTWLFGIALRVASNHRRRIRRRREMVLDPQMEWAGADADSVETALGAAEGRRIAETILDELASTKRAVFVMFELEGMTCDQIADVMGVPVGTIHSRLFAARKEFDRHAQRFRARQGGRP